MYHLPFDIPDLHRKTDHVSKSNNYHLLKQYDKEKSLRGSEQAKNDFVEIRDPKINLNKMSDQMFSRKFLAMNSSSSSSKVTPKNNKNFPTKNRINRRLHMSGDRMPNLESNTSSSSIVNTPQLVETPQGSVFRTPQIPPALRRPVRNLDTPDSSQSASTLELVQDNTDREINFEMSMEEEHLSSDEY